MKKIFIVTIFLLVGLGLFLVFYWKPGTDMKSVTNSPSSEVVEELSPDILPEVPQGVESGKASEAK
jgi:hypothetical protein